MIDVSRVKRKHKRTFPSFEDESGESVEPPRKKHATKLTKDASLEQKHVTEFTTQTHQELSATRTPNITEEIPLASKKAYVEAADTSPKNVAHKQPRLSFGEAPKKCPRANASDIPSQLASRASSFVCFFLT